MIITIVLPFTINALHCISIVITLRDPSEVKSSRLCSSSDFFLLSDVSSIN